MLTSITLGGFRSHADARFEFGPGLSVITGHNGIGKTNILEAIYVESRGSSFRGPDGEIVAYGGEWYKITAEYADDGLGAGSGMMTRVVRYEPSKATGKKTFEIFNGPAGAAGGIKKQRLAPAQKLPLVLFEPEDLRLIHGSPSRRREFLDRTLGGLDPTYSTTLHRYERALLQRNNLLKTGMASDGELFVWEVSLAQTGAAIIAARRDLVWQINERITDIYDEISRSTAPVCVEYLFHETHANVEQQLLSLLHVSRYNDRLRGFTSVGPHRHDIMVELNDAAAAASASRGETRSIILALKFIELILLKEKHAVPPLLLLDDVFSELDELRRASLLKLAHTVQTIITTTEVREEIPVDATVIALG